MAASFLQTVLALPFSRRQKRLASSRPALDEVEFTNRIVDAEGDRESATIIYRKLCDWVYAQGFTPYPDDNLVRIYGMAEEELDEDMILAVLDQLRVPPPNAEQLKRFGLVETPMKVAQLVSFARSLHT